MNRSADNILYLCREDIEQVCKEIDSVAIIRDMFLMHGSGQTILPDEAYLGWQNAQGEQMRSLNMPGYVGGSLNAAGTKIINGNIHNPERGLPRASGVTLLYENASARITCIMEGAYLSSLRTASVTVLATAMLKGSHMHSVAIIGAGVLATAHISLLVNKFPQIRQIYLFDLNKKRIQVLQSELAPLLTAHDVIIQATETAEEAIKAAQLIVPVTTTVEGYIKFSWLQRGSLLVNVSLDDPLPEVVFKADRVFVDDWNLVKNDPRRLMGRMYRQGQLIGPDDPEAMQNGQRRIDAQLGEIIAKTKEGRCSDDEIILVNPFGLAIEDVALAANVYQIALKQNIGVWLKR